jgi:hypothetical protein
MVGIENVPKRLKKAKTKNPSEYSEKPSTVARCRRNSKLEIASVMVQFGWRLLQSSCGSPA